MLRIDYGTNFDWIGSRSITSKTRLSVQYVCQALFLKLSLMEKFFIEKFGDSYSLLFYSGYRSLREQAKLYCIGRTPFSIDISAKTYYSEIGRLDIFNILKDVSSVTAMGMGSVVTNATPGKSMHQYGLACDGVPLYKGLPIWNDAPTPDNKQVIWNHYGKCADEVGLDWGGNWKSFREMPHVQMRLMGHVTLDKLIKEGLNLSDVIV